MDCRLEAVVAPLGYNLTTVPCPCASGRMIGGPLETGVGNGLITGARGAVTVPGAGNALGACLAIPVITGMRLFKV